MLAGMEGIAGSILLLCLISLTNASFPEINEFVYNVCEDTPVDQPAFTIAASDPDGHPLTYTLSGNDAPNFRVEKSTGVVYVARRLDRETSVLLTLEVTVSDGPNERNGDLSIILDDANDNPPIFERPSYDTSVPENTAVGTTLFQALASDADTGTAGIVTYAIDEVIPNDGFSLFSIVRETGVVTLSKPLNYTSLSTYYRLKINASDGGGKCYFSDTKYSSTIVYSFVTVEDVPDLDPQFIGIPYVGSVREHSPVDTSVLKVTAVDQDRGVNDAIVYSIEESSADGLFTISSSDGVISVQSEIDREVIGDTVTLTVKGTESKENIHGVRASVTTTVQINILDVNDNKPEFYKCGDSGEDCVTATEFSGEILEHSLGFINIGMTVKDPDKISNTQLILEGEDKAVFSVEPQFTTIDSIVQIMIRQPENLDFEKKQQMILQVTAVDQDDPTFSSTAQVTINIKDGNDNSPTFKEDTYRLNVSEHSPIGTELITITADDPDTMDKGNLTYKLFPDSILPYFDVELHTGKVYVKSQELLDRELRSLYTATLQARDTDGKPGSTVLEITLTDINDNPPVMNRDSYVAFIREGQELEVRIEATDGDEPKTPNSQIVYGIVSSTYSRNFTIDRDTGVLTNSVELDREAVDPELGGEINLEVTATDQGEPQRSTSVTVTINVQDINDNTPKFFAPSYKFSVKEGEKGAFVGLVEAQDLDQTAEFNRISFSIVDGSFGNFIIRTSAATTGFIGNITVDPDIELDYEKGPTKFSMKVDAADLEQKKATVTVDVDVLDVNDERPEFKPIASMTVKENTTVVEAVGIFKAEDKDGNHSLVFELESVKCRCNNSLDFCDWFVLDPNGEVRVNPKVTVDYEKCHQAIVEAQVVDIYTEKGYNNSATTGLMVINIEDINDNAPEFIFSDSQVFVVVSESASKGTSVAGVTATDRDSGINSQIEFKVTDVKFQNTNNQISNKGALFEAVTTQQNDRYVGIIQSTQTLDLTLKGKYLVTVSATDPGGLSSSTVLDIFTVDESYKVELRFANNQIEVEKKLTEIRRALMTATKAAVEIVALRPYSEPSRATDKTIVVAYFVYANGTALTSVQVEIMLSDPEHFPKLIELGLDNIGTAPEEEKTVDTVKYVLLGIVAGLVIVLLVLTTSLLCTRRNYRRKLKAAKAAESASSMNYDNQKNGLMLPGTNKYTMEGANPVLNLNIDTTIELEESSSDDDKHSHLSFSSDDSKSDSESARHPKEDPPAYNEPLDEALALADQNKSTDNPLMGYSNPVFDTTDL
ncbi:cadherin-related family member 2 isoform X2 [Oreochromis niloticus]|uniref:cadherin-related family member 2 isoform X2 n=1 Tax=Oreochromis niloticus TaxID=8128 RepID=UPI00090579F1|nr:cadherin-related family member 2 isoform X2 [Oreochromis niloticus]